MRWAEIAALCAVLQPIAGAQSPTYGLGRAPKPEEIKSWDIAIGPAGKELPPGSGTAADGAKIYMAKCAACHGKTGQEGPNDVLAGGQGTLNTSKPVKTIGSYWPYATTVWDYINRSMPYDKPASLSADDVYALTAYLLSLNGIIRDGEVMNGKTLPQVKMPNRNGREGQAPDWISPIRFAVTSHRWEASIYRFTRESMCGGRQISGSDYPRH